MLLDLAFGRATYPRIETIATLLSKLTTNLLMIDGTALAERAGDKRNYAPLGPVKSDGHSQSLTTHPHGYQVQVRRLILGAEGRYVDSWSGLLGPSPSLGSWA